MSIEDPIETEADDADDSEAELAVRLERLAAENRRLRREYARARTSQYRRSAVGLAVLGLLGVAGGLVFPDDRSVLFALGGTGLFASVLTYYLTPEQFVPATVGERVYTALARNEGALAADLGLAGPHVYVPTDTPDDGTDAGVRLFVPQQESFDLPGADALASTFVATDETDRRGVALDPTGDALFDPFEEALAGDLRTDLGPLADQLGDALVEQFELVAGVRVETDASEGRVTVGVSGSAYGPVDRFDHPVASFLAVGIARGRDDPVTLSVEAGDDRADYLVTVRRYEPTD
ncbi:MAG: hypothetical protein ABEJ61_11520 [Haloferacaceae archaeon]